jgi:hypothetical protein
MNPQAIKVACSNCNLRELCMPMGLSDQDLNRLDELVAVRRRIKRGDTLFTNGEKFTSLYAIRTGFSRPVWPPKMDATRSRAFRWRARSLAWMAS